jgi:hypothetical protein
MNRTGRNALFSAGVRMENGALGKKFDAYPQRHPVTESSYNNSLADRHIWSTIKTSPATLPEPRSEARGPRSAFHGPPPSSHGPRTGVNGAVYLSDLDLIEGGGAAGRRGLRLGSTVYLIGWRRRWGGFTYYFGNTFIVLSHKTLISVIFYSSGFKNC